MEYNSEKKYKKKNKIKSIFAVIIYAQIMRVKKTYSTVLHFNESFKSLNSIKIINCYLALIVFVIKIKKRKSLRSLNSQENT